MTSNLSACPSERACWQGIVGSLILIGFVAVIALPLGIAASIYLQEYARDTRMNRLLITNIRNLAGVPSHRVRDPRVRGLRALASAR